LYLPDLGSAGAVGAAPLWTFSPKRLLDMVGESKTEAGEGRTNTPSKKSYSRVGFRGIGKKVRLISP
jgi:hypothetical protein